MVDDSGRARYFADTAEAAPVLLAVIQVQSITALGRPVSGSFRIRSPAMYGSPLAWFPG